MSEDIFTRHVVRDGAFDPLVTGQRRGHGINGRIETVDKLGEYPVRKDPYVFDFLTIEEPFRERELETGLVQHLQRFLLELGVGFAFLGRQYTVTVGDDDFYLDLLFYHLKLRCFVVIELKVGPFKPDHVGKMNFYLNVVDDTLRHEDDNPTIGLILCQHKNQVLAEYALRGLDKPIGVSHYELTRALPEELESALPTIEAIEAELGEPRDDDESDDPDEEQ